MLGALLRILGFRQPEPPDDPVFRFTRFYSAGPYWEGRADFAPLRGSVEVLVDCPRTGASPAQRAFFQQLETRFAALLAAARAEIARSESGRLPAELKLVCVELPVDPDAMPWRLGFAGERIHHTVVFTGWSPTEVEGHAC